MRPLIDRSENAAGGYRARRERSARRLNRLLNPVETLLLKLRVHPDVLNIVGLIFAASSGVLIAVGILIPGGAAVLAGGLADMLDGRIARRLGWASAFGAFMDSTLDRFGESFVYLGFLVYLQHRGRPAFWPALALAGALLVSYTRARGESVGVVCDTGVMQRGERLSLVCAACFLAPLFDRLEWIAEVQTVEIAVIILGIATWLTAMRRTWWIATRLRRNRDK